MYRYAQVLDMTNEIGGMPLQSSPDLMGSSPGGNIIVNSSQYVADLGPGTQRTCVQETVSVTLLRCDAFQIIKCGEF